MADKKEKNEVAKNDYEINSQISQMPNLTSSMLLTTFLVEFLKMDNTKNKYIKLFRAFGIILVFKYMMEKSGKYIEQASATRLKYYSQFITLGTNQKKFSFIKEESSNKA